MNKSPVILICSNKEFSDNLREKIASMRLTSDFELLTVDQIKERFKIEGSVLDKFLQKHKIPDQAFLVVKDSSIFERSE